MPNSSIVIQEYGRLFCSETPQAGIRAGDGILGKTAFDELHAFVCSANDQLAAREDPAQFMRVTMARDASGKNVEVLQAQNYVGVLTTKSGTTVEILPKLDSESADDRQDSSTRAIFCHMLQALQDAPFKNLGRSQLATKRNIPLFELLILMFVQEVEAIEARGFRSGYVQREENARFLRGKLLIAQDIRRNPVDKSRVYVRHSSFELDRPENRLIKTALDYVRARTHSNDTRRRIARLLDLLDSVDFSRNVDADFQRVSIDRNMVAYTQALIWCRVFLRSESFTAFRGSTVSEALLFPMERVFEDYVAHLMRKALAGKEGNWMLSAQDRGCTLFDSGERRPHLRPDIVLRSPEDQAIILDTKWKRLKVSDLKPSVPDLYQMYAYGMRYNDGKQWVDDIVLIYPRTAETPVGFDGEWDAHVEQRSAAFRIRLFFLDLTDGTFGAKSASELCRKLVSQVN